MEILKKIKWNLIKLKNFHAAKEIINKMKTEPTEWEKIFANDTIDKGFVSKIYKKLMCLIIKNKQTNKQSNQIRDKHKKTFLQRRHTDGQEAHEKILNITSY